MMADDTLTEIKVSLAEIKMATQNTDRRMSVLEGKIDSYPTRRDYEALEKRMQDSDKANSDKINSLENFQTWIQRAIMMLVIAAIGGLIFVKPAKSSAFVLGGLLQ